MSKLAVDLETAEKEVVSPGNPVRTLQEEFNGDWAALEAALPGLISNSVRPFLIKHQREGVRFAMELLSAHHPPLKVAARVLERFLAADAPLYEIKNENGKGK